MDRDAIIAQIRLMSVVASANVADADLIVMINNAMQEISVSSEWPWLEVTAQASLVDSQQTVALPADFDRLIALLDADDHEALTYVEASRFFKMFGTDDNESTTPEYFTIYEDAIHLYPIPEANDANRLTLYYYKTVTTLDTGSDEPAFHAAFHPMIVEYVKWKIYEREEYYDQSERAFVTFARYLRNMEEWYARRYKRFPFIAGDGGLHRGDGDPNIPWLGQV